MTQENLEKFKTQINFIVYNRLMLYEIKEIVKESDAKLFHDMFPPKPLNPTFPIKTVIGITYNPEQNSKPMLHYTGVEFTAYPKIQDLVRQKVQEFQEEIEKEWEYYSLLK